jgi:hypothetical protein
MVYHIKLIKGLWYFREAKLHDRNGATKLNVLTSGSTFGPDYSVIDFSGTLGRVANKLRGP